MNVYNLLAKACILYKLSRIVVIISKNPHKILLSTQNYPSILRLLLFMPCANTKEALKIAGLVCWWAATERDKPHACADSPNGHLALAALRNRFPASATVLPLMPIPFTPHLAPSPPGLSWPTVSVCCERVKTGFASKWHADTYQCWGMSDVCVWFGHRQTDRQTDRHAIRWSVLKKLIFGKITAHRLALIVASSSQFLARIRSVSPRFTMQ